MAPASMALPNLLSLFRIAIVPVVVMLLMWPAPGPRLLAGAALRRRLHHRLSSTGGSPGGGKTTTVLGQFLDPLADKLLVGGRHDHARRRAASSRASPAWMAVVIVLREIAVTGLRGIASQSGLVVPAQELGKYKMIFQIFALTGAARALRASGPVHVRRSSTSTPPACASCGSRSSSSVWSAVDYYVRVLRQIRLD